MYHYARKKRQLKNLLNLIRLDTLAFRFNSVVLSRIKKYNRLKVEILQGIYGVKSACKVALVSIMVLASTNLKSQTFGISILEPFGLENYYTHCIDNICAGDLDNDGDQDLICFFRQCGYDLTGNTAPVFFLENIGTPSSPQFDGIAAHISIAGITDNFGLPPRSTSASLIDLDGDNDLDFIFRETSQSEFRYFENIGTPEAFEFADEVDNPFGMTSTDRVMEFIDLDADNDLDILSYEIVEGDIDGFSLIGFYMLRNIGNAQNPMFDTKEPYTFQSQQELSFTVCPSLSGCSMFSGDIDLDGDIDLILHPARVQYGDSNYEGGWRYIENDGNELSYSHLNTIDIDPEGWNDFREFVDLDGDTDIDVLGAEYSYEAGGLWVFAFRENNTIDSPTALSSGQMPSEIQIFPNPSEDFLKISRDIEVAQVRVFDVLGQVKISIDGANRIVDTSSLASGNYILEITGSDKRVSRIGFVKK